MSSKKVFYSDLEDAFLFANEEQNYWLDRITGQVLFYSDEARLAVEENDLEDLPEWMNDQLECARKVLSAFGELPAEAELDSQIGGRVSADDSVSASDHQDLTEGDRPRYVSIEQIPSHEAFQFMSDFANEVSNDYARVALSNALVNRKPFRSFKDTLAEFPEERQRWFDYEQQRRRAYIEEWALEEGIEVDFGEDAR